MRYLVVYFVLAYTITWLIWLPFWGPKFGISVQPFFPDQHYAGSMGPALAAFIMSFVASGREGVRNLLSRIFRWKVAFYWYAVVFAGMFLIFLLASVLAQQFDGQEFTLQGFGTSREFSGLGVAGYFLFNLITFGFGEEIGWRGYALPVLQKRYNAFWATTILTVFWACWHLPAFLYRPSYSNMGPGDIAGFFFSLYTGSIILTWLYNSTRGSIFLVALFHAMVEIIFVSDNITPKISAYEGAIMMTAAIILVWWIKPENLSAQLRQQAAT